MNSPTDTLDQSHIPILRRAGWVLIAVGLLDIGFMIYCIVNQMSYSSSLNIFAVVVGVLLVRGNLPTARFVTSATAFLLSGLAVGCLTVYPWLMPWKYTWQTFRSDPADWAATMAFFFAIPLLLAWVYRQLRLPAVVAALAAKGHRSRAPIVAFVSGAALAISMGVLMQLVLNGDTAREAIGRARQQHGTEYDYFVSNINWGGGRARATVVGYNEREVRDIEVEWQTTE